MRHVFVETNWLVGVAAPALDRSTAALNLLKQAATGAIRIYVPACCIAEARKTIRQKFQAKESARLRNYIGWALEHGMLDEAVANAGQLVLRRFDGSVASDLAHLNDSLRHITRHESVEIVPLSSDVLEMSVDLHFEEIEPSEFDRAVLAAVLTKGRGLHRSGVTDINFAELDSKLWPWEKRKTSEKRRARPELKRLYDAAGVWVYSDFTLTYPKRPQDFPSIILTDS